MIEVYLNPDRGAVLGFRIKRNHNVTSWEDLPEADRLKIIRHMDFILKVIRKG